MRRKPIPNSGVVTLGVSFNVEDPDQLRYLEHTVAHTNISAYVKRLIQKDVEAKQSQGIADQDLQLPDPNLLPFI